jgi:hypothetical protein
MQVEQQSTTPIGGLPKEGKTIESKKKTSATIGGVIINVK